MPVDPEDLIPHGRHDLPYKKSGRAWNQATIYDPETDPKIAYEVLKTGRSLTQVASALNVATRTVKDWREKYPEFNDAVELGQVHAHAWWQEAAQENLVITEYKDGPKIKFDTALYKWTMAVRFKEREIDPAELSSITATAQSDLEKSLVAKLHADKDKI
jgi:transposase-like protein